MLNIDFENLRELYRASDVSNLRIVIKSLIHELATSVSFDTMLFHPLGFMYATLHSFPNDETIRLHIWNKKLYDITPVLDIHNHYYKVNSFVYCGCVTNQLYKVHNTNYVNVSQYNGSYASNGDRILTKTNNGLLVVEDNRSIHCAGELYVIEHDQIHSGDSIGSDVTCTVVYTQEPAKTKQPLVFGKGDLPDTLHFNLKKVPAEDVKKLIEELEDSSI